MKPSRTQRAAHASLCMSDRQAKRQARGQTESRPGDYADQPSPSSAADRRRVALLSRLEDARTLAELGIEVAA